MLRVLYTHTYSTPYAYLLFSIRIPTLLYTHPSAFHTLFPKRMSICFVCTACAITVVCMCNHLMVYMIYAPH